MKMITYGAGSELGTGRNCAARASGQRERTSRLARRGGGGDLAGCVADGGPGNISVLQL